MHEDTACEDLPESEPAAGCGETTKPQTGATFHGLLLVSTPIGNLGDMTPRAAEARLSGGAAPAGGTDATEGTDWGEQP